MVQWSKFLLPLLLALVASTCIAGIGECYDATCRVTATDGSCGTGVVFERSGGHVYLLTNAHVATSQQMKCVFWRRGHQSSAMPGQRIIRHERIDAAVIRVPESAFCGTFPRVIPMAPRGYRLKPSQTITSVGCAKGAWATGWKGHFLDYTGNGFRFLPPPADGRSGSAVFDAKGEVIVGLINARSPGPSDRPQQLHGIAISLENLYQALNTIKTATGWRHDPQPLLAAVPSQCGPGGCPPQRPAAPYLPYRRRQDQRDGAQNGRIGRLEEAWPTLPPPQQVVPLPVPDTADADRLEGKIDQLLDPGATGDLPDRPAPLGILLCLAAAAAVGVLLFFVVGKN